MERRTFLGVMAGSLLAAPLAAEAQPVAKVARIGYLAANLAANPHLQEAFLQGLRDFGYVEGRNLVIESTRARPGHFREGFGERTEKDMLNGAEVAARALGVRPQFVEARGPADFDRATLLICIGERQATSIASSRGRSPATSPSSSRRSSTWRSTSRPRRPSA